MNFSIAAASVLLAIAEAITPAPDTSISEWVDQGHVILTERTNSPRPGPFTFDGVEYLREPLDRLHPDDPCSRIPVKGGAQTGKSSIGQLWVCWSIVNNPKSFAIGLPSDGEVPKYSDLKLQPLIDDSPILASRVRPVSTKSDLGSSTRVKRHVTGATIRIFNLSSPKELQMISTGNLILEEVAGALEDVGNRGNPIAQARKRQSAYSVIGSKELMVSTPGEIGKCEVTKAYEAGDQRRYFGKCPACGDYFCLEPEGFHRADGSWGHHFPCPGCGVPLQDQDRAYWRIAGIWIPCFPSLEAGNPAPDISKVIAAGDILRYRNRDCEGRDPSYYVWQAMCGFISLDEVAKSIETAKTPADIKALEQQTFGRAYNAVVEALAWEELHLLREKYDAGIVPSGYDILTGFCDVQGTWLQWGVYGWGPGGEWVVVDRGSIMGDTAGDDVWTQLDEVTRRTYRHADGGELAIEGFGVDTGFRTQRVYAFVRGRPNCYALDGRGDWKTPILGKWKPQRVIQNGRVVGRVKLYPVGTWELKSQLSWSLKLSIEAKANVRVQGRGHWSDREDEVWCQQITAEVLCEEKSERTGEMRRWWKKVRDRNEETDIWVGARALAWNFGVGAPRRDRQPGEAIDWQARAAQRLGKTQGELFVPAAKPPVAVETQPASVPGSGGWSFRKTL